MAYCGPRGLPYSWWSGGRNRWDDLSRHLAVAWTRREATRCPKCHMFEEEWLDADGVETDPPPLMVDEEYCPPCAAAERAGTVAGGQEHRPGMRKVWRPYPVHPTT